MSKSVIRVGSDSRSRYETQAYNVTYGGKSKETGADGYDSRLSATYQANFQISVPVDEIATFTFILPSYCYSNSFLVVEGSGGSPVANLHVEDIDGTGDKTLVAVLDLAAPTAVDTAYDAAATIDAQGTDQRITLDITTAGTGYATVLLKCDLIQTAWK
jgi:hypothetical protein